MKCSKSSTVNGTVKAPASKSMMGRAVAAGLLADGLSVLQNGSSCDDARVALTVAETLGAGVGREGETFSIRGTAGMPRPRAGELQCGESGLTMRMFTPIVALLPGPMTLSASGSLLRRSMHMVEELSALGISCTTNGGYAPVQVRGPLRGGELCIDGSVSSQLLTGLLMALPVCEKDSRIFVTGLKSTPYVHMTMELLKRFEVRAAFDEKAMEVHVMGNQSYRACTYTVEGDWSGAAFLLVAGATAGKVKVTSLDTASVQADRAVMEALKSVGARVEAGADYIVVERQDLRPFEFDATQCPDLFPPLVTLAASCSGKSIIHGVRRLVHKESDRGRALVSEFARLGITLSVDDDVMAVTGGDIQGGTVDAHGDHRIAMACAVAGLRAHGPVTIRGKACVAKSYPAFFSDLRTLEVRP